MQKRVIMKALVTIIAFAMIPAYCIIIRWYEINAFCYNHTLDFGLLFYCILIIWCIFYAAKRKVDGRNLLIEVFIGIITVAYTIPLNIVGVAAGFATMLVYIIVRNENGIHDYKFEWYQKTIVMNVKIIGAVTVFLIFLYIISHGLNFSFYPLLVIKALAPGISEELIFRVLIPLMLYRHFDLDDILKDKIWVFLISTVPFSMYHCIDLAIIGSWQPIISICFTTFWTSLLCAWLIKKYGIIYGMYFHAMFDFLAFSADYLR